MALPTYTLTCTNNTLIAPDVYEIRFTKPEGFTYKAGQFVLFTVPLVDNLADTQPRAYSIASSPNESDLLFVAKMLPGGRASRWIQEVLREGTQVPMQGPFGNFVLNPASEKDYILVATGAGIAPFRGFVADMAARGDKRKVDLIFGVRGIGEFFWLEELNALATQQSNTTIHSSLSRPPDEWNGLSGRVHTVVPQIISDFSKTSLFACGNPNMTKEIKQIALEQWKMEKKDVHVEGYI